MEKSGYEIKTSKYIKNIAESLGYEIVEAEGYSFSVKIDFGNKEYIGFRAELDGLEIIESKNNLIREKEYISLDEKFSHLCGHDFNMSVLIFLMYLIRENNLSFEYNLMLIFESGEEEGIGKLNLIKSLKNYKFKALTAIHLEPSLDSGIFGIKEGLILAGDGDIFLEITGKAGHASRPDLCRSPILAGAEIINTLNNLWSNFQDPNNPITIGIGEINGGKVANGIPEKCVVRGTIRYFDLENGKTFARKIKQIVNNVCEIYECQYKINNIDSSLDKPLVNDKEITGVFRRVITKIYSSDRYKNIKPLFSSETFGHYSDLGPISYILLGVKDVKNGYGCDLHSPAFGYDKNIVLDALSVALGFLYEI